MRLLRALSVLLLVLFAPVARARADELDLGTPRRAVAAFLEAADSGDFARASDVLDTSHVAPADRAARAEQLYVVLDHIAWIELSQLSDDKKGRPEDGENTELIATTSLGKRNVPITLSRTATADPKWLFSAATVARIPQLYEEHGPSDIERHMPMVLRAHKYWGLAPWQWLGLPIALIVALVLGTFLAAIFGGIGARLTKRTPARWDDEAVSVARRPARFFFATLVLRGLLDLLALSAAATQIFARIVAMASIATIAWMAIGIVTVVAGGLERRAQREAAATKGAELRARGVATEVRVLRRVINVTIGIVATALMLMQFELVRNVGLSLLASAGLAGVVLGFAAQRTIGTLIAGIQLSATQPIRIGDSVVIEKEFGTIEEITLTYVVVKIWDERRLIVPMTRFLENPFENWTKTSAELHGTVFFYVDWTFPVDRLREELDRVLDGHPKWDGRTKSVAVTDTKERTLEIRVLVSAASSGDLWDLRVDVREKIVRFLQALDGGKYLPVTRNLNLPARQDETRG